MLRTGVDIIEVSRIDEAILRHGDRFFNRFFTAQELIDAQGRTPALAARFAAKEAVAKALGCGIGDVSWKEIEIHSDARRQPHLVLHGAARRLAADLGLSEWSVSLSHTHEHAVALVVASAGSPMPTIEQARAFYTAADPVHAFDHILRVLALAERIARAEGADLAIVRAAALLHDAAGAAPADPDGRAAHQHASAEIARDVLRAEGWPAERIAAVEHCIRAHRFRGDEPPQTLEARVLFDADKLDVLGAIGAARAMAYAALAGQPLTGEVSARFRATGEKEPGEPHTPYHEFIFKLSRIRERLHTPTARAIAEDRHAYLARYFERLAREVKGEL